MSSIGDTIGSSSVTDHKLVPPQDETWGRCVYNYVSNGGKVRRCGLSEAAHAYVPDDLHPDAPPVQNGDQATASTVAPAISEEQIRIRESGGPVFAHTSETYVEKTREQILAQEGHKDDDGKTNWFAMPMDALNEMAEVMTFGAKKYEMFNYRKGMKYSRLWSAALRHLFKWWRGEQADPETGKSHLAHAMCCIGMLRDSEIINKGTDDRYKA